MSASTALISDKNQERARKLCEWLAALGIECMERDEVEPLDQTADMLFIAADRLSGTQPEKDVEHFARNAPGAPIIISTDAPLWELITQAVRERAWMDVPRTQQYHDLLSRYAISRSPRPKIIMEGDPVRCDELMSQWRTSPNGSPELRMTGSLGEALEMAISGQATALLNVGISAGDVREPGISTLVYALSPIVIAVILEAYNRKSARLSTVYAEPDSRFALLKPPYNRSNIELLLKTLYVDWPSTSLP